MTAVLDKMERLVGMAERLEGLAKVVPRLAEMIGVAVLAGRASERLGGDFATGALGGVVADGLAHSRIPNNQIGGVSLATYFTALGILTVAPLGEGVTQEDIGRLTFSLTRQECAEQGGAWVEGIHGTQGACRLPD